MASSIKTIKTKLESKYSIVDEKTQNKYLRQIAYWVGYFIFAFNDLENTVTKIIAGHIDGRLDENEYAYIFLTGMQFGQKIELLERYYQFMLPYTTSILKTNTEDALKKSKNILTEIKELANTRNTIVHANYYSLDKNGNITSKIKFSNGGVEEHLVSITRDFLVESHNKVLELMEALEELNKEFEL